MRRYFIRLAYDGKPFHGWQSQDNAVSVQQLLEERFSAVTGIQVAITGCGRTDTGVHATDYFAHADLPSALADHPEFVLRMNGFLPSSVVIRAIYPMKPDAHARFDAVSRSYEYRIVRARDPFRVGRAWYLYGELDLFAMEQAAAMLVGEKDFASFCKAGGNQKSTRCTVTAAVWEENEGEWVFHISANRFLRNMVRAVVGSLVEVGQGKMTLNGFAEMLDAGDRSLAGQSAPACGLYLTQVIYPSVLFADDLAHEPFVEKKAEVKV
ncbi:MAG: tRNA pseudouridine(38-40) synthase TruA [Flavobacteriales bacterium]|nr:tRNA pseudouridine(38-40) synthase TruA [Flavobacteriales bacterium]MCB9448787.1 tRNA pseudouridine(38-40) synthase TruA [Flavobacteriales bacterium]